MQPKRGLRSYFLLAYPTSFPRFYFSTRVSADHSKNQLSKTREKTTSRHFKTLALHWGCKGRWFESSQPDFLTRFLQSQMDLAESVVFSSHVFPTFCD